MNRAAKQIFLILSSCVICMHYANATPNLPPLPISDNTTIIEQAANTPASNKSEDTADSVNIDQFIDDVDKKITEKTVINNNVEGNLSASTNSNVPLDNDNTPVIEQNVTQVQNTPNPITQESETSIPVQPQPSTPPVSASETSAIINTQTVSDTAEPAPVNNIEPAAPLPEVNVQPAPQHLPDKPQPVNASIAVPEAISSSSAIPNTNNPVLLVPAYDSEQPKPGEPKVASNNTQPQTTITDSFISDELQVVLYLAPDDIAVGKITRDAYLDQIAFDEYHNIFWQKYYESQRAKQRQVIELFINDYDKKFNQ